MIFLYKGFLLGLTLSILVGPILFSLIEASIEKGIKAGLAIGFGVWVSDISFILLGYWALSSLGITEADLTDSFKLWVGIVGGLVLMTFGIATLVSKPPKAEEAPKITASSYSGYFIKGLLINTVNPFTFFFWFSVIGISLIDEAYTIYNTVLFFAGIFLTIVFTDALKIVLGHLIRPWLKPIYILRLRQISGSALIIFGIVLILRVTVF